MAIKPKESLKNKNLLQFRETKELVMKNYVKGTPKNKRKISSEVSYIPLSAF